MTAGITLSRSFGNGSLEAHEQKLCVHVLLNEALVAAGLPRKPKRGLDKILPLDAQKLFLNGPDTSTFAIACNVSFT